MIVIDLTPASGLHEHSPESDRLRALEATRLDTVPVDALPESFQALRAVLGHKHAATYTSRAVTLYGVAVLFYGLCTLLFWTVGLPFLSELQPVEVGPYTTSPYANLVAIVYVFVLPPALYGLCNYGLYRWDLHDNLAGRIRQQVSAALETPEFVRRVGPDTLLWSPRYRWLEEVRSVSTESLTWIEGFAPSPERDEAIAALSQLRDALDAPTRSLAEQIARAGDESRPLEADLQRALDAWHSAETRVKALDRRAWAEMPAPPV